MLFKISFKILNCSIPIFAFLVFLKYLFKFEEIPIRLLFIISLLISTLYLWYLLTNKYLEISFFY
ncbi:hypothetical protein [Cetobacterium sp.]|uniref:hypothetical protein n=1 Tax=Cetobacterium sp. TaxID=2071632 RepID=UPI003F3639F6